MQFVGINKIMRIFFLNTYKYCYDFIAVVWTARLQHNA